MQNLKYKYRLYPTECQEQHLNQIVGSCRLVFNHFLDIEQEVYNYTKKFNFFNTNSQLLTQVKQLSDYSFLQEVPAVALQQSLKRLDLALSQSVCAKTNKKGFPKFKSRKDLNQSFSMVMVSTKKSIKNNCLAITRNLHIPMVMHRALPSDFKSYQVKRTNNKWFVIFTVTKPKKKRVNINSSVGIDINSKKYVLSNGIEFEIPKYLRENQTKITRLQRSLARKKKGSNNRAKAKMKLARLHEHIANKRHDYFHKLSTSIVQDYDLICLEDLNVKSIQKHRGHIIADNRFAAFRQMIEYKAELEGKHVSIIDRYEPTSKTCSNCGVVKASLPTSERTYQCECCGIEIDRDLNAAININRAGTARINACGQDHRPFKSNRGLLGAIGSLELKQEAMPFRA